MDRYTSSIPTKSFGGEIGGRKRIQVTGEQSKGIFDSSGSFQNSTKMKPLPNLVSVSSPNYKPRSAAPGLRSSSHNPRSKSPNRSTSPTHHRAVSPSKLHNHSLSPTKQLTDVDADTIQRQRRELQLLISELKDRDRELNEMVQAHQKQIVAWEDDRQRVLSLERRCSRLEGELKSRNEQARSLQARIKVADEKDQSKTRELEDTQLQLHQVSEQANSSFQQVQELEEKNSTLTSTMRELSNSLGQLQAREQELLTKLKLKDNDIVDANVRLSELTQKVKRLENVCQEFRKNEAIIKQEKDQWKDQVLASKQEIEKLRVDISKQFSDADESQAELGRTKQEILVLQKELFLAGEREKRKDQLLELQKSKQERTDAELQNLRQICERQQRDNTYMQMQLQSSHDVIMKTDVEANDINLLDGGNNSLEKIGSKNNSPFEDKISYLNGDLDKQDRLTAKSLDFNDAGGSELADDIGSLSQNPLSNQLEAYLPISRPQAYSTPSSQAADMLGGLSSLTIGSTKPEVATASGTYNGLIRPADLNAVGNSGAPRTSINDGSLSGYLPYTVSPPAPTQQPEESSPTSKLHRLLAESRQMVHNLEQASAVNYSSSPGSKQDSLSGSDQFTPPQRHVGSPIIPRTLQNGN